MTGVSTIAPSMPRRAPSGHRTVALRGAALVRPQRGSCRYDGSTRQHAEVPTVSTGVLVLANKAAGIVAGPALSLRAMGSAPGARSRHPSDLEPFESAELTEILYRPGRFVSKGRLAFRAIARARACFAGEGIIDAIVIFREAALIGPAIYEGCSRGRKADHLRFRRRHLVSVARFGRTDVLEAAFPEQDSRYLPTGATITVGNEFLSVLRAQVQSGRRHRAFEHRASRLSGHARS